MRIDFAGIDARLKYKIMTAAIIPRPPALVTTVDRDGRPNAAPYSFFNGFSDDPPIVGLGIARRESGPKKDTGRNIEETGEFVAHLVSQAMFEGMLVTAAEFPEGVDELALAGFATVPSTHVRPPRIAEAPVAFECRRYVTVQCGTARDIVLGEIVAAHIRDDLYDAESEYITWAEGLPIARLYGTLYAPLGEPYRGPVPDPAAFGR
jgi:flavin reductase (DIM6/NTAB) family NADH-FMN oxidoreductase RutF